MIKSEFLPAVIVRRTQGTSRHALNFNGWSAFEYIQQVHLSYPTVFFTWSDVQLNGDGVEGEMFSSKNGYLTNQCLTMLLAENEKELSLFTRLFRFNSDKLPVSISISDLLPVVTTTLVSKQILMLETEQSIITSSNLSIEYFRMSISILRIQDRILISIKKLVQFWKASPELPWYFCHLSFKGSRPRKILRRILSKMYQLVNLSLNH